MKPQTLGVATLAGALSWMALTGGTGIARADDPADPTTPLIDRVVTETPDVFADPRDEGGPSFNWGGTGMYCENMYVRCR